MLTPTMPKRVEFRAAYDAVILEFQNTQPGCNFTNGFYADIATSVFDTVWQALTDTCASQPRKRLHVLSAPVGSGKTTFSKAALVALVRISETMSNGPYGCLFLVEQITTADKLYRELDALLPGKVAVRSREHDPKCKTRVRVPNPAATFSVDDLANFPVLITTHEFYKGSKTNRKAREVLKDGRLRQRALTIVDERLENVATFDVAYHEAEAVRDAIMSTPDTPARCVRSIQELCRFMHQRSFSGPSVETRKSGEGWECASEELWWFDSDAAESFLRPRSSDERFSGVFGFAKALVKDCAFIVRAKGGGTRYVGYDPKLTLAPGMMLLDATADIDGVAPLCPWREHVNVPRGDYSNLEIVQHASHTKERLSGYLKLAKNQHAYVDWMLDIIKQNMAAGQKALVVCKKKLFDEARVPNWPERDPRFGRPEIYAKDFGWNVDGRHLCATHWGSGVGFNDWREADVVFLFDEYFLPRRIAIARAQGLQGLTASEGDLGSMRAINKTASAVVDILEGHTLSWLKQMALRGKSRTFDERGRCGRQKLVVAGDQHRLLSNLKILFPGAKAPSSSEPLDAHATHYERLVHLLRPSRQHVRQLPQKTSECLTSFGERRQELHQPARREGRSRCSRVGVWAAARTRWFVVRQAGG